MRSRGLLWPAGIAAFAFAATFLIVTHTYFYADDFFLLFYTLRFGANWANLSHPVYGHFAPGLFWFVWLTGRLGGLARTADAYITALLATGIYLMTYLLTCPVGAYAGLRGRRAFSAFAGCLTVVAPLSLIYIALGDASLPQTLLTLVSIALLAKCARGGSLLLAVAAAVACALGFLFWELALLGVVVVPCFAVLMAASWADGDVEQAARELGLRRLIAFEVPALIGVGLYWWQYSGGGYGAGVPPPSTGDWITATLRWIPQQVLPTIGGGPTPDLGGPLVGSSGQFTHTDLLLPLLVGIWLVAGALLIRRTRFLAAAVVIVGLIQGAVIVHARLRLEGDPILDTPRYMAFMLPYLALFFSAVWMQLLGSPTSRKLLLLAYPLVASALLGIYAYDISISRFHIGDRRAYVNTALRSLASAPGGQLILPGPLPALIGQMPIPYNTSESLLYPAIGQSRFWVGSGRPFLVDERGILVPAVLQDPQVASAPRGACLTSIDIPTPLGTALALRTVVFHVRSRSAKTLLVRTAYEHAEAQLYPGLNTVYFQTWGGVGPVSLYGADGGQCLERVETYVATLPAEG
jgi:hypothetical protein